MTGPAPNGDGVFDIEKLRAIFARLVLQASSNDAHLSRGARTGEASVCKDRRPHARFVAPRPTLSWTWPTKRALFGAASNSELDVDCGNLQYCQSLLSLRNV